MRAISILTASCAAALILSACAEQNPTEPSTEPPTKPSLASGVASRCGVDEFSYTCLPSILTNVIQVTKMWQREL